MQSPPKSLLFVPAIKIDRYLSRAKSLPLDGIIYDLEDSVGEAYKEESRRKLLSFFPPSSEISRYLRINSFRSGHWNRDLEIIRELRPEYVVLAKVEDPTELENLDQEFSAGDYHPKYVVAVETLQGHKDRESILCSSSNIALYVIGYEDLSSELGIERPALDAPTPLNYLIMENILTAKRLRLPMIDAVSRKFQPKDWSELRREIEYGFKIGFCGKIAVHPNQVALINSVYSDEATIQRSIRITKSFESLVDGSGVVVDEYGEMVDLPSLRLANRVLSREL